MIKKSLILLTALPIILFAQAYTLDNCETNISGNTPEFFQKYFYILEQVMAGALDYVEHAAKHNITFTKSELEMLLNSYLSKPHMIPHSLAHIFDIDDDVTGNGTVNALQFFGLNK